LVEKSNSNTSTKKKRISKIKDIDKSISIEPIIEEKNDINNEIITINNDIIVDSVIKINTIVEEITEQPSNIVTDLILEDITEQPSTNNIYESYSLSNEPYRIYYRGSLIFDSAKHKEHPIFNNDNFILFGKIYIYRGIRFEKY